MKKTILSIAMIAGVSFFSFSQTAEEIKAQRATILSQTSTAAKTVGLDDKKIEKLKSIFEELFKSQDEIKADTNLTPEQKKEGLKKANEKKDWKVQNLFGDKLKDYAEARKKLVAEAAAKKSE